MILMGSASAGAAVTYYVDNDLGDDQQDGLSPLSAWQSLTRASQQSLAAGDWLLLKRGGVWRDTLAIQAQGTAEAPIRIGSYGTGPWPRILLCDPFDDWTPIADSNPDGEVLWQGQIEGIKRASGAVRNGQRLKMVVGQISGRTTFRVSGKAVAMDADTLYVSNQSPTFYVRTGGQQPTDIQIGVRQHGIYVENSRHLIIEEMDLFGPGAKPPVELPRENVWRPAQLEVRASDHIEMRNIRSSHNVEGGLVISLGSTHTRIENATMFGHGNTGLYYVEAGPHHLVTNSHVYDCGNLDTDSGDLGLIGIWRTSHVTIDRSRLSGNGRRGYYSTDAAASFVQSQNGTVLRSHISNTGGTALQFADGSDNGLAAYNVIDRWGQNNLLSPNNNEGIRIGGGMGRTARNCRVFNNLIMNGGGVNGNWAALRVINQENSGLKVFNNIFWNNEGVLDVIAESLDNYLDWEFSHNLYYRNPGPAIIYNGQTYDLAQLFGNAPYTFASQTGHGNASRVANPDVDMSQLQLIRNSPCIDEGRPVEITEDYHGNPVPSGRKVDIGPFEFQSVPPAPANITHQ